MINLENTDDKELENVDKHQPYGDDFNPYQKTDADGLKPEIDNKTKDLGLEDDHSGTVPGGDGVQGNGGDDPSGGSGSI